MKDACVNFRLGREGFGFPLAQVREIATAGRIAPVPLAPPVVRGIANWRGRVITLIDVATVFDRPLPPARSREERLALIFAEPYEHLGAYVHAPVEIAQAVAGAVQARVMAAGAGPGGAGADDFSAPAGSLATVGGRIVHILSTRDLVAHCEAKILEGFRRKT